MTTPIALTVKAERFFRGNQDVQVLKQGKDPAQSCCTEGGGCWLGKKRSSRIRIMDDILRQFLTRASDNWLKRKGALLRLKGRTLSK